MADMGTDDIARDESSTPVVQPLSIGYAQLVEETTVNVWRRWMAVVVGAWLLVTGAIGLPFFRAALNLLSQKTPAGAMLLSGIEVAMVVATVIMLATLITSGVGFIVFARRRAAVRAIAIAMLVVYIPNIAMMYVSAQVGPMKGRFTGDEFLWWSIGAAVQQTQILLPVLAVLLGTFGQTRTPWRWPFRLGWWLAIVVLLNVAAHAVRFEGLRRSSEAVATPAVSTIFHNQPELAVQAMAAVGVVAMFAPRDPKPRRAAAFGCAGLLIVVCAILYPMFRVAYLGSLKQAAAGLTSLASVCGPFLIPVVVIAICWKRLPDRAATKTSA